MIPAYATPPRHHQMDTPSNGGRLVATDGRVLPLVGSTLVADAEGGVARVVLEQRFRNPHAEPLTVTYSLPLPADGAVSGFSFVIGDRRVVGEVDRKQDARDRFAQAVAEGRTAAILEQDRSSLFTQEIGNIPPGEEIVAEIAVDQRLQWLGEGAADRLGSAEAGGWEWRFPTVVAPRYLGEPGRVADARRVAQDVADRPIPARISMACRIRDAIPRGDRPESPSHVIDTADRGDGVWVELRHAARLDRDVVVRWPVRDPKVGVSIATARPERDRSGIAAGYGLLTIVPPSSMTSYRPIYRDLIVLIDTSGSMGGAPLEQAKRVVSALVDTLNDGDQIELIEFSSSARRWRAAPVSATASARREAIGWIRRLDASGSTEMRTGILEALRTLRQGSQRQVVLVTDGQIGFESEVVAAICERLPSSAVLHTVGVGSAVNRSLTGPAARAGRGIEVVIGLGEDPERAASRLVARTHAPILVELEIEGSALIDEANGYSRLRAPIRAPHLFAGAPALISVKLRPEGGEIRVTGRTAEGAWSQRMHVPPIAPNSGNQAVVTLFGRELVEDLELDLAAGGSRRQIDAAIERIGLDLQIATRLTSWIAVTQKRTVDPRDATRRERMPHELPYGMSAEGVGLRAPRGSSMVSDALDPDEVLLSLTQRTKGHAVDGADLGDALRADIAETPVLQLADEAAELEGGLGAPTHPRREASDLDVIEGLGRGKKIDLKARLGRTSAGAPQPPSPVPAAKPVAGPVPPPAGRMSPPPGSPAGSPPPPPAAPRAASPSPEMPEPTGAPSRLGSLPEKAREIFSRDSSSGSGEAQKKGGLIDAVRRFFGGEKKEAAPLGERRVAGRVAIHKDGELVIELDVSGADLDWNPEGRAEITQVDGWIVEARIDASRSTRAGILSPGQTVRLTLRLPASALAGPPRTIALLSGSSRLIIEV